jgi:hypothetical protein
MPTCATHTANETTSSHAVGAIAHTGQGEPMRTRPRRPNTALPKDVPNWCETLYGLDGL